MRIYSKRLPYKKYIWTLYDLNHYLFSSDRRSLRN